MNHGERHHGEECVGRDPSLPLQTNDAEHPSGYSAGTKHEMPHDEDGDVEVLCPPKPTRNKVGDVGGARLWRQPCLPLSPSLGTALLGMGRGLRRPMLSTWRYRVFTVVC